MGRDYPEECDYRVKPDKKKQKMKKSPKKETNFILRKSLRNLKTVDYKETSNFFDNRASSTSEQKATNSKTKKSVPKGTNEAPKVTQRLVVCNPVKRILFNCPMCELPMFSKENLKKHYKSSH